MAKKRSIKVISQSGHNYKATPTIMLKGQWLKKLGFDIGDYVSITCENGKLVITPDAERAAIAEAEADFMEREIESLKKKFEVVIVANEYDITLVSNNTHHVWYIHNVELPDRELCIVFHKHKASHPYHNHSWCGTLKKAIKDIKSHDQFQLNGRRPVHRH